MTDTMSIWRKVEKTDPAHTKHVSQRGGFTAINANYQIMNATEQFGPIGIGWGYTTGEPIFHDALLFVPVTLWHGDRSNTFGPMLGCEEWKDKNGRVDSDSSKKATTDAITKLLSQLGFNADVFLGKFDDQKYVAEVKKEFEPVGAKITPDQVSIIQGMLEASGIASIDFCNAAGVDSIPKLDAEHYHRAVKWIKLQTEKKA